jgi:hypothetical protein
LLLNNALLRQLLAADVFLSKVSAVHRSGVGIDSVGNQPGVKGQDSKICLEARDCKDAPLVETLKTRML